MTSPRFSAVSRALVEARVPAMFNLFSSARRRRSISPASADINWLNLDEPDITAVLLQMTFRSRGTLAPPRCSIALCRLLGTAPGKNDDYSRQKFLNRAG